jgi:hypothetical protein
MITVHIGLGKCASTTLQKNVFTKLNKNIEYNNNELCFLAREHHIGRLSSRKKDRFNKILRNGKSHFLSIESLVNWDPEKFEMAADLNLELFGKQTNIIIVVRDTLEYITSIYQQHVQRGSVIPPNEYFVNKEMYDEIQLYNKSLYLKHFNVEAFSLQRLHNLYNDRFDNVFFIPISKISSLSFIKDIYNISNDELKYLQNVFKGANKCNVSYSAIAMNMTFARERLANLLGFESSNPFNASLTRVIKIKNNYIKPDSKNTFLVKLFYKFKTIFIWRNIMQKWINNYLPYKKYKLPEGLLIPEKILKENSLYLKEIENDFFIK